MLVAVLGVAAAIATAPSLGAPAASETSVTAAAAGEFPLRTSYGGSTLGTWTVGAGVVVLSDGSAVGDFEISVDAVSATGQPRQITLVGEAAAGQVKQNNSAATFSGSATLTTSTSSITGVPFTVSLTSKSSLQLTIGTAALPSVKLGAGSVFIG